MKRFIVLLISVFTMAFISGCADDSPNGSNANINNNGGLDGNGSGGNVTCETIHTDQRETFKQQFDRFIHRDLFPATTPFDDLVDSDYSEYELCSFSPKSIGFGFGQRAFSKEEPLHVTYNQYRDYVNMVKNVANKSQVKIIKNGCGDIEPSCKDQSLNNPYNFATYGCDFRAEMINPQTGKVDHFSMRIATDKDKKNIYSLMGAVIYDYKKTYIDNSLDYVCITNVVPEK